MNCFVEGIVLCCGPLTLGENRADKDFFSFGFPKRILFFFSGYKVEISTKHAVMIFFYIIFF